MRRLHIGLDFDGVLSDCGKLKSEAAKRFFGVDIPSEKFKKELVVGTGLLTLEQYRELQQIVYATREVGLKAEPVEGMLIHLPRLLEEGHRVRIVTSRSGPQLEIAQEWALKRGLIVDFIGMGYGKSKAGAAAGMDLYVDDDLDKLEPLVGVVPHRYLFSWGYNRHLDETGVASRVASWQELYDRICGLAAGT